MQEIIEKAIKEARKKKPGVIISRDDIYGAIFKAGQGSITKLRQDEIEEFYNAGKLAGIREVVECLVNDFHFRPEPGCEHDRMWQAKLKEWGIKRGADG